MLQLEARTYLWKNDEKRDYRDIGFIAQEILKIFPEVVFTSPTDGNYGVNYPKLIPVLTKAIQEQQLVIETQAQQLAAFEAKLALLMLP